MIRIFKGIGRRGAAAVVAAVALIFAVFGFEPATRSIAANQVVCLGCHDDGEYDPVAKPAVTKVHAATPDGRPARCVECHLPEGNVASLFVYTHIFSNTDLFGNWRDWDKDRAGPYYPPIAKKAYKVRDAMLAADSSPCRTCHIEEEIKPKRKRGRNAHKKALKRKETCMECHYNLVHREVDLRPLPDE